MIATVGDKDIGFLSNFQTTSKKFSKNLQERVNLRIKTRFFMKRTIEVCANSFESALAAQNGGADRIELCSALDLGGITPSFGLISLCKQELTIPINVLIRPREGDFHYTRTEIEQMAEDIALCGELGVNGVVFGALTDQSAVDTVACSYLMEVAKKYNLSTTFHRAIDVSYSILYAIRDIVELGFDRILTSGGCPTALEGIPTIADMVEMVQDRVRIIAASGINSDTIVKIATETKAPEIHFSAGRPHFSAIFEEYRKVGLSFTPEAFGGDYLRRRTDPEEVKRCINALAQLEDC